VAYTPIELAISVPLRLYDVEVIDEELTLDEFIVAPSRVPETIKLLVEITVELTVVVPAVFCTTI
jgi:hypothetical protein